MMTGVFALKRWFLIGLLVLLILLKLWIPSNVALQREVLAFLGLERETVQALGHSLQRQTP